MSSDQQSVDEKALHRQLYELRREGFEGVELVKLPDLTKIAVRLAPNESEPRRQVEVSIELAIEDLSQDQEVARLWFGLHSDTRDKDKDEREDRAAKARYVSVPAFRSHIQKPLIEAIRRALLERYEPSAEPEPVDEPDPPPRGPSFLHLRGSFDWGQVVEEFSIRAGPLVVVLGVLALIAAIVTWTLLHQGADAPNPAKEMPPRGTVVSAEDGSIVTEPDKSPIGQLITEPAGGSFRACDVTTVKGEGNCKFLLVKRPIAVEMGDVLWIGRSLREQGEVPLPFVTLIARRRWENNHSAAAEMVVEWPGVRRGNERDSDKIIFEMPGEYGYVNLVYVPGSTELRGPSWHDFIAHLPDGIMEGGISLANLGPPVSCFECFDQYKRYVFFKARLEGHHSSED